MSKEEFIVEYVLSVCGHYPVYEADRMLENVEYIANRLELIGCFESESNHSEFKTLIAKIEQKQKEV